jgi:hypothetical protein
VKTSRDDFVIDISRERLVERLGRYFDPEISDDEIRRLSGSAMENAGQYNAKGTREYLLNRGFLPGNIVRYAYRPFDTRWLYWEPETYLLDRKREEYFSESFTNNLFLFTTARTRKTDIEPALVTQLLCDLNCMDSGARGFPMYVRPDSSGLFPEDNAQLKPNLTQNGNRYVAEMLVEPNELLYHSLAILDSPQYRYENKRGLHHDWPRIPLPSSKEALVHSAELGRRVSELLDTELGVAGVTEGRIQQPSNTIGIISRVDRGQLQTEDDEEKGMISELRITAGWGHGGKGGITMPGKGKLVQRDYTPEESKAIEAGATRQELSAEEMFAHLGEATYDIYLNDVAYWRNIPARVWDYTIGGYQVIKKWLSYREHKLLGRPLTDDEAREVMNIARRIASILLLEPSLDDNYQSIKTLTYPWPPR